MIDRKGLVTITDELRSQTNILFNNEILEYKQFKDLIKNEYENREKFKINIIEHKKRINEQIKNLLNEVKNYKSSKDINTFVQNILNKDEITKLISDAPNEIDFINSVMKYQRAKFSINYTNHYDKFDWFKEVKLYTIKWTCSYCNQLNSWDNYKKDYAGIKDTIFKQKCTKCSIIAKQYRVCSDNIAFIKYQGFQTNINQLKEKISLLEKFIESNYSKNYDEFNNYEINEQRYDYEKNKNKLPHKIRKFIELVKTVENKSSLKNDFNFIINKEKINLDYLEKYKMIQKTSKSFSEYEIAYKVLSDFIFKVFELSEKNNNNSSATVKHLSYKELKEFDTVEEVFLYDIDGYLSFNYLNNKNTGYIINEFFFKNSNTEKTINISFDKNVQNLFQSGAEYREYFNLLQKYPNHIILPKYPLQRIVNFLNDDILVKLKKDELEYLKRSYVNYAIYSQDGNLVKLYDLQVGPHHLETEFYRKDVLKQKLSELINVKLDVIV